LEEKDSALLRIVDLHVSYGQIKALTGISMNITEGEVVSLIGANGAGKSTFLKTVSGLLKPKHGDVFFSSTKISGMAPERITRLGVIHVPEGRQILGRMTVRENLELGTIPLGEKGKINEKMDEVMELFPVLKERLNQLGGTLSGGEQQMLAIGRALMADPRILMMDEPSLGLAPILINDIFKTIKALKERKKTILLVEQNAKKAILASDRCYVLETGRIVMEGPSAVIINDDRIKQAYLGGAPSRGTGGAT
jgi:branched-chain amino acid transport system ATP-binding protein